jgi:hypothetical protein
MRKNIFKTILVIVLFTGLIGCSSVTPTTTTLKYGNTDQDGDSVNGSYGSENFTITQTFTWK